MKNPLRIQKDSKTLKDVVSALGGRFTTENVCHCPNADFHKNGDKNASGGIYRAKTGVYRYGCNVPGCTQDFCGRNSADIIDLIAKQTGRTSKEVFKEYAAKERGGNGKDQPKTFNSLEEAYAWMKKTFNGSLGRLHEYRNADGEHIQYVIRWSKPDGDKEIRPLHKDGNIYVLKFPPKCVIYNLPEILSRPDETVIICEGEEKADYLMQYGFLATCSPKGAKSAAGVDWSPLAGRRIVLWPDYDDEGEKYVSAVCRILRPKGGTITKINPADLDLQESEDAKDFIQQLRNLKKSDAEIRAELQRAIDFAKPVEIAETVDEQQELDWEEGPQEIPLIRMSDVQGRVQEWLWQNRVPLRAITIFAGPGESGKTHLIIYLIAMLTTGRNWVDCNNHIPAGTTLFIGEEDDFETSLRPQLDAAGADVSKVVALDYEKFIKQSGSAFNLAEHINHLRETVRGIKDLRAIIFDPLNGYLGKINSNNDADARTVLIPLQNIAKKSNIAIIGIAHLNKKSDLSAIDRVMGSKAFTNTARAVWFVTYDPETGIRYLTKEKANLAINTTNLSFKIVDNAVAFIDGTTDKTADDVLQVGRQKSDGTIECVGWLEKQLQGGPVYSTEINEQAKEEGFTRYAIEEAKRTLKVQAKRDAYRGKWRIQLPQSGFEAESEGNDED